MDILSFFYFYNELHWEDLLMHCNCYEDNHISFASSSMSLFSHINKCLFFFTSSLFVCLFICLWVFLFAWFFWFLMCQLLRSYWQFVLVFLYIWIYIYFLSSLYISLLLSICYILIMICIERIWLKIALIWIRLRINRTRILPCVKNTDPDPTPI